MRSHTNVLLVLLAVFNMVDYEKHINYVKQVSKKYSICQVILQGALTSEQTYDKNWIKYIFLLYVHSFAMHILYVIMYSSIPIYCLCIPGHFCEVH